jgi:hypothetical protein
MLSMWATRTAVRSIDCFDWAGWASRPCEPVVAGEQGGLKGLCEGDVCGVVEREILTQVPAAAEQIDVSGPLQRNHCEIMESHLGTAFIDLSGEVLPPKHGADFEVYQPGRSKLLAAQPLSCPVAIGTVIGEGYDQHAGVNDEHGPAAVP